MVGTAISPASSTNDYFVLESRSPAIVQEIITKGAGVISSMIGGTFNCSAVRFSYNRPCFVRYYRFWPCLKRPASEVGKSIVTNEHGQLYSLSLNLVVDYRTLYSFHPAGDTDNSIPLLESGIVLSPDQMQEGGGGFRWMDNANLHSPELNEYETIGPNISNGAWNNPNNWG